MFERLSPQSQRALAIALLVLAVMSFFVLIVAPVGGWVGGRIEASQASDQRLARLQAIAARPDVAANPTEPGLALEAATAAEATQLLTAHIEQVASRVGLAVAAAPPSGEGEGALLAQTISANGDAETIVRFIEDLERSPFLVRLDDLSITSTAPGQLTLSATVKAAAVTAS